MWHFDKCRLRRTGAASSSLSLETPNDVQSVAQHSLNIQATSKGSDQTARMRRLIWGFAGRTYHIVGNPCGFVVACWERADLLAFLCVMFLSAFLAFTCGVSGRVRYLIVSIPDLCLFLYF